MTLDDLRHAGPVYLCSPYTRYKDGIEQANEDICRIAARLMARGVTVFCPIAHSHAIAMAGNIDPLDHEFWMRTDKPFMEWCKVLLVAELPGWEDSKGICDERRQFRSMGKPAFFLDPVTLEVSQNPSIGTL